MNKKYLIVFLFLVIGGTISGQDIERKFTIQADPIILLGDVFGLGMWDDDTQFFGLDLEGQYKINDALNFSLTVSFLINNVSNVNYAEDDTYPESDFYTEGYFYTEDVFHISIAPMLIYRPSKTGLKGFYLGLYPHIGLQSNKSEYGNHVYAELGLGFNIGYKWILKNGFTIQLSNGIRKIWSIPQKPEDSLDSINTDLIMPLRNFDILMLDFKLGYSF
jgi:hypothetical protein